MLKTDIGMKEDQISAGLRDTFIMNFTTASDQNPIFS